jgi:cytochrome d ubiquinol oxidase subunit I
MGVTQHYLFEARQMQALSLAVHIPLVCFGIAFPVLVLFAEYRYLRTGDVLYRVLARRWSRIMLALFAVGVVTGTILSFELGLLWPVWMQDFGNVLGSASRWRDSRSSWKPSSSGSMPMAGTG